MIQNNQINQIYIINQVALAHHRTDFGLVYFFFIFFLYLFYLFSWSCEVLVLERVGPGSDLQLPVAASGRVSWLAARDKSYHLLHSFLPQIHIAPFDIQPREIQEIFILCSHLIISTTQQCSWNGDLLRCSIY